MGEELVRSGWLSSFSFLGGDVISVQLVLYAGAETWVCVLRNRRMVALLGQDKFLGIDCMQIE